MKEIKVIIAGPRGRMGKEAVLLMEETEHFNLVAAIDYKHGGGKYSDIDRNAKCRCTNLHGFTYLFQMK